MVSTRRCLILPMIDYTYLKYSRYALPIYKLYRKRVDIFFYRFFFRYLLRNVLFSFIQVVEASQTGALGKSLDLDLAVITVEEPEPEPVDPFGGRKATNESVPPPPTNTTNNTMTFAEKMKLKEEQEEKVRGLKYTLSEKISANKSAENFARKILSAENFVRRNILSAEIQNIPCTIYKHNKII